MLSGISPHRSGNEWLGEDCWVCGVPSGYAGGCIEVQIVTGKSDELLCEVPLCCPSGTVCKDIVVFGAVFQK